MGLKAKIKEDIKWAMRRKDELRLLVLRMFLAAVHNSEIEKKAKSQDAELSEEELVTILRSEVKKRRDAIFEFEKGGRKDLVEKETAELKILEIYIPQEPSDGEVEKLAREVLKNFPGASQKDFGRIMGDTMKRLKGQVSGDRVSGVVKKILQ